MKTKHQRFSALFGQITQNVPKLMQNVVLRGKHQLKARMRG